MVGRCFTYSTMPPWHVLLQVVTLWISLYLGRFNISCFTATAWWAVVFLWKKVRTFITFPRRRETHWLTVNWLLGCQVYSMSQTAYLWSSPPVSLTVLTIFAALSVATGMVIFGHSSNFMLLLKSSYLWSVQDFVFKPDLFQLLCMLCHRGRELWRGCVQWVQLSTT